MLTDKILLILGILIIATGITLIIVEINYGEILTVISFIISLFGFVFGIYQFIRKN